MSGEATQLLHSIEKTRRRVRDLNRRGVTLSGIEKLEEEARASLKRWDALKETKINNNLKERISSVFGQIQSGMKQQRLNISRISSPLYPVYLQLLRIGKCLDDLRTTSEVFTCYDIMPLQLRLIEIEEQYIENGDFVPEKDPRRDQPKNLINILHPGQAILRTYLEHCYRHANLLLYLTDSCHVESSLIPVYNILHSIRRKLERIKYHNIFNEKQIIKLQKKLSEISLKRLDGKFIDEEGGIPKGQAILNGLFEQNYELCRELSSRNIIVSPILKPIHSELASIKLKLEQISEIKKFVVDPADILYYYKRLIEIDESKIFTKSTSMVSVPSYSESDSVLPEGQAAVHYLLHKCYRLVYNLLNNADPVDSSIRGTQNQLLALRRCLQELRNSHQSIKEKVYPITPATSRCDPILRHEDLVPIQLKLNGIDNLRIDGKFLNSEGEIPEGQSTLHSLMNECYDFLNELFDIAEENDQNERDFDNSNSEDPANLNFQKFIGKPNLPVVPLKIN